MLHLWMPPPVLVFFRGSVVAFSVGPKVATRRPFNILFVTIVRAFYVMARPSLYRQACAVQTTREPSNVEASYCRQLNGSWTYGRLHHVASSPEVELKVVTARPLRVTFVTKFQTLHLTARLFYVSKHMLYKQ